MVLSDIDALYKLMYYLLTYLLASISSNYIISKEVFKVTSCLPCYVIRMESALGLCKVVLCTLNRL